MYMEFLYFLAVFELSFLYHGCALLAQSICILPFELLREADHAAAEGVFLLIGCVMVLPAQHRLRRLLFLYLLFVHVVTKTAWNARWIPVSIGTALIVGGWIKHRRAFSWRHLVTGCAVVGVAFVLYELLPDVYYAWSHALWHVTVFVGVYFVLRGASSDASRV